MTKYHKSNRKLMEEKRLKDTTEIVKNTLTSLILRSMLKTSILRKEKERIS